MKRTIITAAVIVVAAVAALAAYAYYSGNGASASTQVAQAGHAPLTVTVTVDTAATSLYPGDQTNFTGTITNTSGHRAHVGNMTASLDEASLPVGCLAAWFNVGNPTLDGGPVTLTASGPGSSATFTSDISFADLDVAQDACSDASLKVIATTAP